MHTTVTPITIKGAAAQLGISMWAVYQLAQSGRLPSVKLRGRILTTAEDVDEYVESLRRAS